MDITYNDLSLALGQDNERHLFVGTCLRTISRFRNEPDPESLEVIEKIMADRGVTIVIDGHTYGAELPIVPWWEKLRGRRA